jgi:apolipoprotein N-acyltransferase
MARVKVSREDVKTAVLALAFGASITAVVSLPTPIAVAVGLVTAYLAGVVDGRTTRRGGRAAAAIESAYAKGREAIRARLPRRAVRDGGQ